MELIKNMFTSEQNSKTPRRFFSAFFLKSNRSTSQKFKKTQSCENLTKKDNPQKISCLSKSPIELQNKFQDCTWGLTYQKSKKTLILDLDNTLIYASKEVPECNKYIYLSFEKEGQDIERYIVKRPGLLKFLKKLSKSFNICVFTSAEETYAKKIVEATKISKYIYTIYDRSHCEKINDFLYLKNIWSLGFEQKQAVLIDDFAMQKQCQPDNCIHIKSFEGDTCDRELYVLYPFLQKLSDADDVRPVQKNLEEHIDSVSRYQDQKKQALQDYDQCGMDLDEGCRRSCIRTFECHPSMARTDSRQLVESVC